MAFQQLELSYVILSWYLPSIAYHPLSYFKKLYLCVSLFHSIPLFDHDHDPCPPQLLDNELTMHWNVIDAMSSDLGSPLPSTAVCPHHSLFISSHPYHGIEHFERVEIGWRVGPGPGPGRMHDACGFLYKIYIYIMIYNALCTLMISYAERRSHSLVGHRTSQVRS